MDSTPPSGRSSADGGRPERRARRVPGSGRNPRVAAAQFVARHRLDDFARALGGLAVAVFGPDATVVPHMRATRRGPQLTFVVDAADAEAGIDYAAFLPREQAFWTAYAHMPKPDVSFAVAVRPARGWCRSEALAPLFTYLPVIEDAT